MHKDINNIDEWFDEWFNLFPKGVKSGGRYLRSDRKSTLKKMKSFLKDYGYSVDDIIKATKEYLYEKEQENYIFTRCAIFFLGKKDEGSTLAERIENHSSLEDNPIMEEDYFG